MSKIICDICGTTYPDSAAQCPICGCVKPANAAVEDTGKEGSSSRENYTYVKGGRFSKKNVKKRHQLKLQENNAVVNEEVFTEDDSKDNGDKGLVIAIIVLLIAVIAVAAYITVRFFAPFGNQETQVPTVAETVATTVETEPAETTEETVEATVDDVTINLDTTEVILEEKGAEYELGVSLVPEDITDSVVFASGDETIATVTQQGKISAVGAGETVITVTCGETIAECKVSCTFTEGNTAPNTDSNVTFKGPYKLNKEDVMIKVNETFKLELRDDNKNPVPVTFEIQNPDFCSVDGNMVTGTAKGTTKVSVTYEGETYSCIVRVK